MYDKPYQGSFIGKIINLNLDTCPLYCTLWWVMDTHTQQKKSHHPLKKWKELWNDTKINNIGQHTKVLYNTVQSVRICKFLKGKKNNKFSWEVHYNCDVICHFVWVLLCWTWCFCSLWTVNTSCQTYGLPSTPAPVGRDPGSCEGLGRPTLFKGTMVHCSGTQPATLRFQVWSPNQ